LFHNKLDLFFVFATYEATRMFHGCLSGKSTYS
jgi:hypothetical protein